MRMTYIKIHGNHSILCKIFMAFSIERIFIQKLNIETLFCAVTSFSFSRFYGYYFLFLPYIEDSKGTKSYHTFFFMTLILAQIRHFFFLFENVRRIYSKSKIGHDKLVCRIEKKKGEG